MDRKNLFNSRLMFEFSFMSLTLFSLGQQQITILLVIAVASGVFLVRLPRNWVKRLSVLTTIKGAHGRSEKDLYTVEKCPNPDCIRCRRYTEVNRSAQKRLPWVIRDLHRQQQRQTQNQYSGGDDCSPLWRIQEAVRLGPSNQQQSKSSSSKVVVAPADGQYPTVLLVPGLSAEPVVTQHHSKVCGLFEGTQGEKRRQMILEEYIRSHQHSRNYIQHDKPKHQNQNHENDDDDGDLTPIATTNKQDRDESMNSIEERRGGGGGGGQWLENDVQGEKGKWEVLHLLNQGEWIYENMMQCPQTSNFVQTSISGLIEEGCIFGNVFISVLEPDTVIERHCGPTNVRHRLHFALQIPSTAAPPAPPNEYKNCPTTTRTAVVTSTNIQPDIPTLTVLDQTITWTEGECFVFDDSLVHSANYPRRRRNTTHHQNDTKHGVSDKNTMENKYEDVRAVLIVDLWHPELSTLERQAIAELYPTLGRRRR